jgi:dCTP deaminase
MLSDRGIKLALSRKDIWVEPVPDPERIQPASIDLCLGTDFIRQGYMNQPMPQTKEIGDVVRVLPEDFILATTLEEITIGNGHVGRIEGKSSFGRLGLTVHITAGFIDPGFSGQVTLEMVNLSRTVVCIEVGKPICQISFETLDMQCERPYGSEGLGSHYQNQRGAKPSALSY